MIGGGAATITSMQAIKDLIAQGSNLNAQMDKTDMKNSDILGALTPPQAEVMMNERMAGDVDARGPCGLTPLMVASFRGGRLDQGEEEDTSSIAIEDLIAQGSNLNAQMDKTGETPLHLAS